MSTIEKNIAKVGARIREAAQAVGREPATVGLLAVSKTQPAAAIRDAFAAGNGERDARECVDAAVYGPIALRNVAGRENHATTTPEPSTIPHLTRSRWRSSLPTR